MNFKEFAKEITSNIKQKAEGICEKDFTKLGKDFNKSDIYACKIGVLNGLNEVLDNSKIKEHFGLKEK